MSCILIYFSFLCQLKGHKASNKLVTKDFDLKFGYKNGFLADTELFINFHTFHFRPRYLPKYVDMRAFPPIHFFLGCVEALHQISASQDECKWKKVVSLKDSLSIFC